MARVTCCSQCGRARARRRLRLRMGAEPITRRRRRRYGLMATMLPIRRLTSGRAGRRRRDADRYSSRASPPYVECRVDDRRSPVHTSPQATRRSRARTPSRCVPSTARGRRPTPATREYNGLRTAPSACASCRQPHRGHSGLKAPATASSRGCTRHARSQEFNVLDTRRPPSALGRHDVRRGVRIVAESGAQIPNGV